MSAVQRVDVPGVIDERVTISVVDGIADVKMNRADKRNALDNAMFTSLLLYSSINGLCPSLGWKSTSFKRIS